MTTEEIINLIKERESEGRVVFYQAPGILHSTPVACLCDQPADGILYDLNRDEASILAFASDDNPYWVNNYATAQVIRHLKNKVEELEQELNFEKEKVSILNERLDEAIERIIKNE